MMPHRQGPTMSKHDSASRTHTHPLPAHQTQSQNQTQPSQRIIHQHVCHPQAAGDAPAASSVQRPRLCCCCSPPLAFRPTQDTWRITARTRGRPPPSRLQRSSRPPKCARSSSVRLLHTTARRGRAAVASVCADVCVFGKRVPNASGGLTHSSSFFPSLCAPANRGADGDGGGKEETKRRRVQVVDVRGSDFAGACQSLSFWLRNSRGVGWCLWDLGSYAIVRQQGASCPGPSTFPRTRSRRTRRWTAWWHS